MVNATVSGFKIATVDENDLLDCLVSWSRPANQLIQQIEPLPLVLPKRITLNSEIIILNVQF